MQVGNIDKSSCNVSKVVRKLPYKSGNHPITNVLTIITSCAKNVEHPQRIIPTHPNPRLRLFVDLPLPLHSLPCVGSGRSGKDTWARLAPRLFFFTLGNILDIELLV